MNKTFTNKVKKSNHYTIHARGITPKLVTSGGHRSGLAPGQHNFEETSRRWPDVGDIATDLTGSGIPPETFRTDNDEPTTEITGR